MSSAYLIITNVAPEEWHAEVTGSPQVIGRLAECDIVIPGKYVHVSRRHAIIEHRRDELYLQDLGSSGGTLLNSVPLIPHRPTRLVVGDRISLSGIELYFVSSEAKILRGLKKGSARRSGKSSNQMSPADARPSGADPKFDDQLRTLSPAELEVLRWIGRGLISDKEIAFHLFRSPHTVRTQVSSIFQKLGVHSREQLISVLKQREIAWTMSECSEGSQADTDNSLAITDTSFQSDADPSVTQPITYHSSWSS